MIFDKDVIDHFIQYIKENPEHVFNEYCYERKMNYFNVQNRNNSSGLHYYFSFQVMYNSDGVVVSINGETPKHDTTELIETLKATMKKAFTIQNKLNKLGIT